MKNSFKELEELEMKDIRMKSDKILMGVNADIGIMKYIGSIVELYFPKIVDLFVGLAGGPGSAPNESTTRNTYPDRN